MEITFSERAKTPIMALNTPKGAIVTFLGFNGYDRELEKAKEVFEVGKGYEVKSVWVGDWDSTVEFVGVDGRWNTVMFSAAREAS